jgi:hypothetical protein
MRVIRPTPTNLASLAPYSNYQRVRVLGSLMLPDLLPGIGPDEVSSPRFRPWDYRR